jgi:hypothetical protein
VSLAVRTSNHATDRIPPATVTRIGITVQSACTNDYGQEWFMKMIEKSDVTSSSLERPRLSGPR